MAEFTITALRTGVIRQRGFETRITAEAVRSAARRAPGNGSLPVTVEHDPFGMPIGKVTDVWVEESGEDCEAMARVYLEEEEKRSLHARSGTELVLLDFEEAPEPFRGRYTPPEDGLIRVGADFVNFQSHEDYEKFTGKVREIDGLTQEQVGRYSAVPEPLVQFVVSNADLAMALAIGYWVVRRVEKFVRYTVDETSRKLADRASDVISSRISRVVKEYQERHADQDRSTLNQVVIPGNMDLVLLVKVPAGEEFPGLAVARLVTEMENYGDLLQDAQEATFALVDHTWELQHLKTRTGQVVGTSACYENTVARLERIRKPGQGPGGLGSVPRGFSVGRVGSVGVTDEDS